MSKISSACEAAMEGALYTFTLLFHIEECKWKIVIRD